MSLQFWNGHAQHTCLGRKWFRFPFWQLSRYEHKLATPKLSVAALQRAGETTNDCKLPERGHVAGFIKEPFLDFEQAVADQQFSFRFNELRSDVFEIDAFK